MKFNFSSVSLKKDLASFFVYNAKTACSKENQEIIPNWLLNKGIKEPQSHRGFGIPHRPNPLASFVKPMISENVAILSYWNSQLIFRCKSILMSTS